MNQEQIVAALNTLTAPELVKLTKQLEEQWGVSATPVPTVEVPTNTVSGTEKIEAEQTEFTVSLNAIGTNKIGVIKIVREITGLALKEAKELTEAVAAGTPKVIKENATKADADAMQAKFAEAGANVSRQ